MRLQSEYLSETAKYYNQGAAPPASIHEAIERCALEVHGVEPTEERIQAYRSAARALPTHQRAEIFFLRANDLLFRPQVVLNERTLSGNLLTAALSPVPLQEVLVHPRM